MTNPAVSPASTAEQMVALLNPMSEKQSALRTSLIPGIMWALERNLRHGRPDCAIFELGRVFSPRGSGEQPEEVLMVVGAAMGKVAADHWATSGTTSDFFYLKGLVESLLSELQCDDVGFQEGTHPALSERATAEVRVGGEACGFVGEVNKSVRERFDVPEPVLLFELDLESLRLFTGAPRLHEPIPKFPPSRRDLAIVVAEHVQAKDLTALIRSTGGELIDDVNIFDLYRGHQVPSGMKSLAFSIKYLASDRTLTDEDVNRLHQRIVEALVVRFHARLREE